MKDRIILLMLTAFLLLMISLTVFADVIDEPLHSYLGISLALPIAIIILVAVLVITTVLIIRKLKKSKKGNEATH